MNTINKFKQTKIIPSFDCTRQDTSYSPTLIPPEPLTAPLGVIDPLVSSVVPLGVAGPPAPSVAPLGVANNTPAAGMYHDT